MNESKVKEDRVKPSGGASWKGRRATRLQVSSREVKMLKPDCRTCAEAVGGKKFLPQGWQNDCPHDPYIRYVSVKTQRPVYEDDPETGGKVLVRTETVVTEKPVPRWVGVTHSKGTNSGLGPEQGLRKGFIYPQQLRSPLWPNGIKRRCQFRECYAEDLKQYNSGWFCRKEEAQLVRAADKGMVIEIGDFDNFSTEKRKLQLEQIPVAI